MVIGKPEADPITESIPQKGQSAVWPMFSIASVQSIIASG